ncbi:chemotaxis protein CheA [Coprothermobacter platensis]|uniref:chemotaxis protein CheA n=1 Tax=Coprothermobacter platensis TaxID=108819 RepID=UPI0003768781|nr:chemotaxis protein CheA [Coprothermobacter platensis]
MDDMNEYLPIFLQESYDYINLLNNNLVLLEQDPGNKEALAEVFRAAHTLKGMSATMGFQPLADASHALESALQMYRDSHQPVAESAIELGFKVLDYVERQVKRVEDGEVLEPFEQMPLDVQGESKEHSNPMENQPASTEFNLGVYEEEVVRTALEQGQKASIIRVVLEPGVLMKGVRAFMVFKAIEDNGFEAIGSEPDAESLEKEEFENEFKVLIVGNGDVNVLRDKILRIAEVSAVEVTEINANMSGKRSDSSQERENPIAEKTVAVQEEAANKTAIKQEKENSPEKITMEEQDQQKKATRNYIRVPEEHVESLMSAISELVLEKAELELAIRSGNQESLLSLFERINRSINVAQTEITALRMTPLSFVFERFPRMVRDLSRELGKQVRFIMEGGDTEIDRTIIDRLGDPLVHVLRNAIDHGIEKPEDRVKAGKDPTGTVKLRAYHEGNNVYIVVEDDGEGVDTSKVLSKAIEKGLVSQEQASYLSQEEIINFLFLPGFSTSTEISEISGRGVGLDVFKNTVEELGGSVQLKSVLGKGTTVIMRLPLTMAIISALLVKVQDLVFALPLSVVEEISNDVDAVKETPQGDVLLLRGELLPVYSLSKLLKLQGDNKNNHIIVIKNGQKKAALLVAETVGKQEIVIKPLKSRFVPRYVDGATLLGDGTISLVINISSLLEGYANVRG